MASGNRKGHRGNRAELTRLEEQNHKIEGLTLFAGLKPKMDGAPMEKNEINKNNSLS